MAAGSTLRSFMYSRNAPAAVVRTTSLTVQSAARRTAFTSSSGSVSQSKRRCGPSGPLMGVSDGGSSAWVTSSPSARARISNSARRSSVSSRSARKPRIAASGIPNRCWSSSRNSSPGLGDGRGTYCTGSGGSFTGSTLIRSCARSTPDAPSIMQWWIFVTMANCSPPASPSTIHISQSGRSRSSCCAMMRPPRRFS